MQPITTLSPELAREVQRLVRASIASSQFGTSEHFSNHEDNTSHYIAKATENVEGFDGETIPEGRCDIYRRNTLTLQPVLIASNQKFQNIGGPIGNGDWIAIHKDAWGDYIHASSGQVSGSFIEFQIEDDGSSSGSASASSSGDDLLCSERVNDAPLSIRAKVIRRPCGVDRVPFEDDAGYVTVHDIPTGGFLRERTRESIQGKSGFACLLSPNNDSASMIDAVSSAMFGSSSDSGGDGCKWIIAWINWFQERQFLTDIIFKSTGIKIERANAKVWDYCKLPDEYIDGDECDPDSSSSGSSSGAI